MHIYHAPGEAKKNKTTLCTTKKMLQKNKDWKLASDNCYCYPNVKVWKFIPAIYELKNVFILHRKRYVKTPMSENLNRKTFHHPENRNNLGRKWFSAQEI